eukprot:SAG11_NODE_18633_length_485_cov_0.953368_1_plen_73_part_00
MQLCEPLFNGSAPWFGPDSATCSFDQLSGALWDQRSKQLLLSRGVAVVIANPAEPDSWDAGPSLGDPWFVGW